LAVSDLLSGFQRLRPKPTEFRGVEAVSATSASFTLNATPFVTMLGKLSGHGPVLAVDAASAPRQGSYVVHAGQLWKVAKATPSDDWFSDEVRINLRQEDPRPNPKISWLEDTYMPRISG
jgi:hypothetical protein